MSMSRRKTLAVIGGGVILAATAGLGYVATRQPQTARLPWASAGQGEDARRRALSYALLAPNPHNIQPSAYVFSTISLFGMFIYLRNDVGCKGK